MMNWFKVSFKTNEKIGNSKKNTIQVYSWIEIQPNNTAVWRL